MRQGDMDFTMTITFSKMDRMRRRLQFLEAVNVQLLRDGGQLREWFSATELAAMALPSMPRTRQGVLLMAKRRGWPVSIMTHRGVERQLFHFTSLPPQAFQGMIDLVLRSAVPPRSISRETLALPVMNNAALGAARVPDTPVAPAWVLPLLRLCRGGAMPLDAAVRELPAKVGPMMHCPSLDEARAMLLSLGLKAG